MSSSGFPYTDGSSHLERSHPHIVNRLRQLWGQPEGSRYLAELMVDARGGRAGFSREVFTELLTLTNDYSPLPISALRKDAIALVPLPAQARGGYADAHDRSRRRMAA